MSQQLIVQNDDDEDYVQFTVEIPDGYDGFKITTINGTMINQNYLNIGDAIKFKFSNNPIIYNDAALIILTDYTSQASLTTSNQPFFQMYEFTKLDLFNIYRVKYIPIYAYYANDSANNAYIFNPADDTQLLPEPLKLVKDYNISTNSYYTCPFTGKYVIGLQKVNKIDDINVIVGESISNSKTQPSDESFNEAGEVIADNQVPTNYNYGNSWRYNVSNLLMNHKFTIWTGDDIVREQVNLCYVVNTTSAPTTYYTTNVYDIFANFVVTNSFRLPDDKFSPVFNFYKYNTDTSNFDALKASYKLSLTKIPSRLVVHKNNTKYEELPYDPDIHRKGNYIPGGFDLIGSSLKDSNNYCVAVIADDLSVTYKDINTEFPINDNWHYTGNVTYLKATVVQSRKIITNKRVVFNNFNTQQVVKADGETLYSVRINGEADSFNIRFYERFNNQNYVTNNVYLLGESFVPGKHGVYKFISSVNTGYIEQSILGYELLEIENPDEGETPDYNKTMKEPLQLTCYDEYGCIPADDDLIVKHIVEDEGKPNEKHGLLIHQPNLRNRFYIAQHVQGENRIKTTSLPMIGYGGVEPLVFIPKKSKNILQAFNTSLALKPGLMKISSVSGGLLTDLIDDNCNVFIADGHETLNVEPPQEDDYKFKTFNGNLTFDRSSTRITRLFSMTNSNSCIGYLNDILAARLSRYYFVANYNIFNVFINKLGQTPLSNSLNQLKNIYTNYKNDFYTGSHEITLATCSDLVKLIGADVITNNCMPGITPEEHTIKCQEITQFKDIPTDYANIEMKDFYYKLFHYYDSGFNQIPSVGGTSEYPNGLSIIHPSSDMIIEDDSRFTNAPDIVTINPMFITHDKNAKNTFNHWTDNDNAIGNKMMGYVTSEKSWNNNSLVQFNETVTVGEEEEEQEFGGIINVLPVPRIYRDNNFEQNDLTISTGRIKTLSPIYIQSVNRIIVNNLLYMFDMVYNTLVNKYGTIVNENGTFDYWLLLHDNEYNFNVGDDCVLRRFGQIELPEVGFVPLSFDSAFVMNYLTSQSVNDYLSTKELIESLPTKNNTALNEEIIENMITIRPETNIQLFSSRYFNFHENISLLSMVVWSQVINQQLSLGIKNLYPYFGKYVGASPDDATYVIMKNYIDEFFSSVLMNNSYNITRINKTLISKLGEFLDFPKIIFGATLAFNQSRTINIQYLNPVNYVNEFETEYKVNNETNVTNYEETFKPNQKQKNNVGLFGVVFKYYQLSLGWQQMINDSQEVYEIARSRGQKHFVVKIYDEFGRQIPNIDTSQGFKNNLRLEVDCYVKQPQQA